MIRQFREYLENRKHFRAYPEYTGNVFTTSMDHIRCQNRAYRELLVSVRKRTKMSHKWKILLAISKLSCLGLFCDNNIKKFFISMFCFF